MQTNLLKKTGSVSESKRPGIRAPHLHSGFVLDHSSEKSHFNGIFRYVLTKVPLLT